MDLCRGGPMKMFGQFSSPSGRSSWEPNTIEQGHLHKFLLFLLYVGRITLSARLNGRGKIVVEQWWKMGSRTAPVKVF
nr:hypothetical transcript [Hymenolepis microstoma]